VKVSASCARGRRYGHRRARQGRRARGGRAGARGVARTSRASRAASRACGSSWPTPSASTNPASKSSAPPAS
jgi:hypothetical protein